MKCLSERGKPHDIEAGRKSYSKVNYCFHYGSIAKVSLLCHNLRQPLSRLESTPSPRYLKQTEFSSILLFSF